MLSRLPAVKITTYNLPVFLNLYEKILKLNLYIQNATINQYVTLLDKFALIEQLKQIELKLDTSSEFYKENTADGTDSILELVKKF